MHSTRFESPAQEYLPVPWSHDVATPDATGWLFAAFTAKTTASHVLWGASVHLTPTYQYLVFLGHMVTRPALNVVSFVHKQNFHLEMPLHAQNVRKENTTTMKAWDNAFLVHIR